MMQIVRLSCTTCHDDRANRRGVKSVLAGDLVADDAIELRVDCTLFVNQISDLALPEHVL